jgi:hypothetical protein
MPNPWTYAAGKSEHAEQTALFMWSAMGRLFGWDAAEDRAAYDTPGYAARTYGPATGEPGRVSGPHGVPELEWLHAIHNQGHGDAIRGSNAKAEGVKRGVPDTFLPVPRWAANLPGSVFGPLVTPCADGGYGFGLVCGLYVELKVPELTKPGVRKAQVIARRAGETSEDQDRWIAHLRATGYAVAVCEGWRPAANMIRTYLTGIPFEGLTTPNNSA